MSLLTLDSVKAWTALLPADFAAEVGEPDVEVGPFLKGIANALPALKDSTEIRDFIANNQDAFIGIGRAGRIRFLAWCRGQGHPDYRVFMEAITEGEASGDGSKGTTKVAPYFKQDIEAIAAVMGRRQAREMVDGYTLEVIAGASYEAISVLDMRGGAL